MTPGEGYLIIVLLAVIVVLAAKVRQKDVEIERLQEMLAGKTEAVQELSDEVANLGVYAVQLQETIERLEEDPT